MAHAAGDLGAVSSSNAKDPDPVHDSIVEGDSAASRETFPTMPHLFLSEEELAARHPSILAPDEESLHDFQRDEDENVFMYSCKIAASIQSEVDE